MTYGADYFGRLLVSVAKTEQAKRSHQNSVSAEHIPFDTGATQSGISLSNISNKSCIVEIGGAAYYDIYLQYAQNAGNTSKESIHRAFVDKFIKGKFVNALKMEFGQVKKI
ncbi:MAG: hypothetical protein K2M64_04125 [Clostridia bacterium]|nr:hypothetical protein [Clostridia bacterium]